MFDHLWFKCGELTYFVITVSGFWEWIRSVTWSVSYSAYGSGVFNSVLSSPLSMNLFVYHDCLRFNRSCSIQLVIVSETYNCLICMPLSYSRTTMEIDCKITYCSSFPSDDFYSNLCTKEPEHDTNWMEWSLLLEKCNVSCLRCMWQFHISCDACGRYANSLIIGWQLGLLPHKVSSH